MFTLFGFAITCRENVREQEMHKRPRNTTRTYVISSMPWLRQRTYACSRYEPFGLEQDVHHIINLVAFHFFAFWLFRGQLCCMLARVDSGKCWVPGAVSWRRRRRQLRCNGCAAAAWAATRAQYWSQVRPSCLRNKSCSA